MVEPVLQSATWTRSGTPEDALSVIEAYTRTQNGRVVWGSGQLTLRFGSRVAYRLLGFMTQRVPYAVRVSAAASEGAATRLIAEAYRDEGPYLVHTELAARTYAARISKTLSELQRQ
jgi:hypothetical protein